MTPEEKAKAREQAKRFLPAPLSDPPVDPAPAQRKRIKKIRDLPMQVYVKRAKSIRMYSVQLCKNGKVFTAGEYETVEDACRAAQEWTDKIEK
jgi:hypothetical protein